MKFYFTLLGIFFFSNYYVNAQTFKRDIRIKEKEYTITSESNSNGEISFELFKINEPNNKKEFKIQKLNEEILRSQIAFYINELSNDVVKNDEELKDEVNKIFYAIAIKNLIEKDDDDQPFAGTLKISDKVKYEITIDSSQIDTLSWCGKRKFRKAQKNKNNNFLFEVQNKMMNKNESNKDKLISDYIEFYDYKYKILDVKEVEIEFRDSYIETIKVNAKDEKDTEYRFENKYGIGISSRNAINKFDKLYLYDNLHGETNKIKISDLLNYDYSVQLLTRDFSPSDTIIKSIGGQQIKLKKEKTSKLFEAIIYSDFIGIDKNKPNGLIQTEVSKRININPNRKDVYKTLHLFADGFGYFQYIKPSIVISKIEQDNRSLISSTKIDSITKDSNTTYKINTFLNPINILNHQNLSLGLDLNLLFFDKPDFKYNLYINGGFRFGRTAITDSVSILDINNQLQRTGDVKNYGINYFTYYPEISLHILPEERYGLYITNRWQYFRTAFQNPNLIAYDINSNIDNTKKSNWINTFELMTYVKTGFNGRIFARWRFNRQLGNRTQNFHQVQVGYSFYFLKRNN